MSRKSGRDTRDGDAPKQGASPWAFAARHQFTQTDRKILAEFPLKDMSLQLQQGSQSLWVVPRWPSGAGLAIRTSFSPEEGLEVGEIEKAENSVQCRATSPAGEYTVLLELPQSERPVLHFTVRLTPAGYLSLPFWPSDTYPIDASGDPFNTSGTVHAAQRGCAMAMVYASVTQPQAGSFLYFQNLTALNDLCEQTHAAPDTRVGGSWPELGYTPPLAERHPLQPGREIVLSDAYVCFSPSIPEESGDIAQLFFDMASDTYLQMPRPEPQYQEWLEMAERSIKDLEHPDCITKDNGKRYVCAYVGTTDRRPESLVQLAVALPLLEYQEWSGRKIPLIGNLLDTLPGFYDKQVGCILRYPRHMKDRDGEDVDEKGHYEVDSWYLYHPLLNLGRLALRGDEQARKLLMDSVQYAIDVAHHFHYDWPVLFDAKSLEVVREEEDSEKGETDVAALYAYLMLQLYRLTDDERYVQEATNAAEKLKGLHFNVGYQFNNTAWGANALARLWQITGDIQYLHLSYMCLASIFQNVFMWECTYGYGKHYHTFMRATPLREAPYVAAYEELEIIASFYEYLDLVGPDVSDSIQMLLCEYCKYTTDGKISAFPMMLPEEVIAGEPRNGHINRDIAIPLEDIYEGWQQAGQVGQEVYGGGMAPAIACRSYVHVDGAPFTLHCHYPLREKLEEPGRCQIRLHGDPRLACQVRLIPLKGQDLSEVRAALPGDQKLTARKQDKGHITFAVPGASVVQITWPV